MFPEAEMLIDTGYINAFSFGFAPIEWEISKSPQRRGGVDFIKQELLEISVVSLPANANALIEARSYRGRREPTLRELGAQLGRLLVAARLRNALPPRRTSYAERVAIAAALRRGE
jgi:phage head maturation protease